jgi:hypothetical protein
MTPSGIEPATFRSASTNCATAYPFTNMYLDFYRRTRKLTAFGKQIAL